MGLVEVGRVGVWEEVLFVGVWRCVGVLRMYIGMKEEDVYCW